MADSKISALTELTGANVEIAADVLPIVDDSVTTTKKIKVSNLLGGAYTTAGDIVQASGAGVAARLGIGTKRQVPTVNSGATALAYANPITIGTMQATTSGTEFDFTGIPSGVRRITIHFLGVSVSGTDDILVQIGDSGGFETSGYISTTGVMSSGGSTATTSSTAGFVMYSNAATDVCSGTMTLNLMDAATFQWVSSHSHKVATTAAAAGGGEKALSAELTQVRITRTGTDTFDAGAVNISYE